MKPSAGVEISMIDAEIAGGMTGARLQSVPSLLLWWLWLGNGMNDRGTG